MKNPRRRPASNALHNDFGPEVRTRNDLADACGVSRSTVQVWLRRPDWPKAIPRKGPWTEQHLIALAEWRTTFGHAPQIQTDALGDMPESARDAIVKTGRLIRAGEEWDYPDELTMLPAPKAVEVMRGFLRLEADTLENQVKRGEYVKRSEIDEVWERQAHAVKARLQRIPRECCSQLAGESNALKIETILDDHLRAACNELADATP